MECGKARFPYNGDVMDKKDLEDVENYLVKRLKDGGHIHEHSCLHHDITNIFAELCAKEKVAQDRFSALRKGD